MLRNYNVNCDNLDTDKEEELFEKVDVGDHKFAFKCQNDKFMARAGPNEVIKCLETDANKAEKFDLIDAGDTKESETPTGKIFRLTYNIDLIPEPNKKEPEQTKSKLVKF
jgi:hypothetical protein